MFSPGSRVRFITIRGPMLGTVEEYHGEEMYTVRADDGVEECEAYRFVLLLKSLTLVDDDDSPFVVSMP